MKTIIFFLSIALSHFWISPALADDNTCWIQAPDQNDVWVIIYDADGDGNRGKVLWEGKIASGHKQEIQSTDGHIRYNFKTDPDQPYEGDLEIGCTDQQSFLVE